MADDLIHTARRHSGDKQWSPFSAAEMSRRQDDMRRHMAGNAIDAVLFTSYHCICFYSGFLYCQFGRKYGFVVTAETATTLSAAIDGAQPYRRTFGDALTYTDWRKDNYYRALKELMPRARRIGIEFDHVSLDFYKMLQESFPGIDFVDISTPSMAMRMIKSAEEHALIREGARISEIGGRAAVDAVAPGVGEYEVAIASTNAMIRAIAENFPFVELMDTWTWFQTGINTDGAHNPVTNRIVEAGDILSLNTFPMIFGYYTALERTLFCKHASDSHLAYWERNCAVHRKGLTLIRPGARCCDIAAELNDMYRGWDLLKYRSFGYGHSFGVLSHYYGREAGLELREDCETVLVPGMVVSMEPMIMIPDGLPGAGGYREHDLMIVTEDGCDLLTTFPFGPEHNIV